MKFLELTHDLPVLETPRLRLRKLRLADAPSVFAYASLPRVSAYCTWPHHPDLAATQDFLEYWTAGYGQGEVRDWAWERKEDGQFIGTGGLVRFDESTGSTELGYVLNPAFWGQGYATEGVQAILDWAFQADDLMRVIAHCMPGNKASQKVLTKCGLHHDGLLRQSFRKRGIGVDVHEYSLLRRERLIDQDQLRELHAGDQSRIEEIVLHAFQYDPATGLSITGVEPSELSFVRKLYRNQNIAFAHGIGRDGQLAAFILYTWAPQPQAPQLRTLVLSIMGTDPLAQRLGLGTRLLRWSVEQIRPHADLVYLVGHPGFYPRAGFQPLQELGCTLDIDAPAEACLGLALSAIPSGLRLVFPEDCL